MNPRILYATDLGLYSPYLMKQLTMIALSMKAKVDVLHVVEPMGVFAESIINTYVPEKERRYLHQHGIADVTHKIKMQVESTLRSDYKDMLSTIELDDVVVELGLPAQVIIEQAYALHSTIILLGSHGQSAFQGGAIGSVVSKVLDLSSIPVIVVPMMNLGDLDRLEN